MVEAPIAVNIDQSTIKKVKEAKRMIKQIVDHRTSHQVVEARNQRTLIVKKLEESKPKEWRNIPLDVVDFSCNQIAATQALQYQAIF